MKLRTKTQTSPLYTQRVQKTAYRWAKIKENQMNLNEQRLNIPMKICVAGVRVRVSLQIID